MRIELITEFPGEQVIGLAGLKSLADNGNIRALNMLGEWILMGYECSPDVDFAFKCFRKAAKKGNTQAMLNLGVCYMNGYGVEEDFYTAERWIRAALECKDSAAMGICEQLYTTTIGDHKPDLKTYVDLVYAQLSKGEKNEKEKEVKESLLAQMILKASGVSDISGALQSKVTENDIIAFETMNDIRYGATVKEKKKTEEHISKKRYCEMLAEGISEKDETDLADLIAILYNLCDKNDKKLRQQIKDIKYCRYTDSEELTWLKRALYEVEPDMFGKFKGEELKNIIAETIARAETLDNKKLEGIFNKTNKEEQALTELRNKLRISTVYQDNIRDLWINKISKTISEQQNGEIESVMSDPNLTLERLFTVYEKVSKKHYELDVLDLWEKKVSEKYSELEENEVSTQFDQFYNDYSNLLSLFRTLKTDVYRKNIKEKWSPSLRNRLCELQKAELDKICLKLEARSYEKLKYMLSEQIIKYSFDNDIFESYRARIQERVDFLEEQSLKEWCKNTDNLSVTECTELIEKITKSGYDEKNTQPYISRLEDKKESLIILEDCDVKKLEEDDLDRLNEKISAVHFSKLDSQIKDELVQRINSYIDLVHEGKDKASNRLREKCKVSNLIFTTLKEYDDLLNEVKKSRFSADEKNKLISQVVDNKKQLFLLAYKPEALRKESVENLQKLEDEVRNSKLINSTELHQVLKEFEILYDEHEKIRFSSEYDGEKLASLSIKDLTTLKEMIDNSKLKEKQQCIDIVKKHFVLLNECEEKCEEIRKAYVDDYAGYIYKVLANDELKKVKRFYFRSQDKFLPFLEKFFVKGCISKEVFDSALFIVDFDDYLDINKLVFTLDSIVEIFATKSDVTHYKKIGKFRSGVVFDELLLYDTNDTKLNTWFFSESKQEKRVYANFFNEIVDYIGKKSYTRQTELNEYEKTKKHYLEQRIALGSLCDDPRPEKPVKPATDPVVKPTKMTVEATAPVAEPSAPQVSQQQAIANLVQVLKAAIETKSTSVQPEKKLSTAPDKTVKTPDLLSVAANQPVQQASAPTAQPTKMTVEPVVPVSEPSVPQVSQRQTIVNLVQATSAAKSNAAQSVQHTTVAEPPKQSEKIGINEMREYAKQLRISNLLDFENVSIDAYLNRYPIFSRSIKAIESDEYGVVLIKNSPVDILLTNTSVLWQLNHGRESFHAHPGVKLLNSIRLKNGKITDSIAMSDYEICPQYDAATNECILAFLKYAALGVKTDVKQIPQQDVMVKDQQQYIDNIDASMPLDRQIAALKKKYISNVGFKYHVTGEVTFAKKYPKAVAAYANVSANENPLVMEDSTIFGSAKTGFVLTDRQIFIKSSDANKIVIPVESVVAVFKSPTGVMGDYRIKLMSKSGDHIITSFTDGEKAQKATEFFEDLFELLKRNREKNIVLKSTPVIEATNESVKGSTWTCQCGKVNTSNFCAKCGKKREAQVEMWKCSCGNECKGNFCNKCGNPRNK